MTRILIAAVVLLLAGCATRSEPPPVVIAASCVPKTLGRPPAFPFSKDDLAKAPEPSALMKELYADLRIAWARLNELEPVVADCR